MKLIEIISLAAVAVFASSCEKTENQNQEPETVFSEAVAGTYTGYSTAEFQYSSTPMVSQNQTLTVTAEEGGTVSVSYTSDTWGTFSLKILFWVGLLFYVRVVFRSRLLHGFSHYLFPVLARGASDLCLEHSEECGRRIETDILVQIFEQYIIFGIGQYVSGFIDPVHIDIFIECLACMAVNGSGNISPVGAQFGCQSIYGKIILAVDAVFLHSGLYSAEKIVIRLFLRPIVFRGDVLAL